MSESKSKSPGGAAVLAEQIVAGNAERSLETFVAELDSERKSVATVAARVVEEVATRRPALAVPYIDRLVALLWSDNPRVVQTCATALSSVTPGAPAKVAKHLNTLTSGFQSASDVAKDGLVRTFAGLCNASIAYQKRLIAVLESALSGADPKTLKRWSELVLPALKGEPHATARAVVEGRLSKIPRKVAREIADYLGVKLRPVPRR